MVWRFLKIHSKMVRKRPRIPRTHSEAGTTCRERRSQWKTSRRTGRSLTDRIKRRRWSPERLLVYSNVTSFVVNTLNLEFNSMCRRKKHSFFPLKYFDGTRSTFTDLDVMQEKRVDDYRNVDSNRSLLWEMGCPRNRHSAVNRRRVRMDRESTGLSVTERTTVKLERWMTENMCWWSVSTRHDTWMTDYFGHTKAWATRVRVMKSDQTVQCDVLTHCAHLYMLYESVFCSLTRSIVGNFIFRQPNLVRNSEEISRIFRPWRMPRTATSRRPIVTVPICWRGRRRRRQQVFLVMLREPPACSKIDSIVILVDSFEWLSSPVPLNSKTACRFEDRFDSHTRRFLRMIVFFAVWLVDQEEWLYNFVESLSHIRRAIFWIHVVDLVVVEHRPDSIWVPNVLHVEFFQVLLRRMNGPPRQSCHIQ